MSRLVRQAAPLALLALAAAAGCAAEIGDSCDYDIDCSPNMDRNCDHNQPGGYCLILGCEPDSCPSEAVCVEFTAPCPIGTPEETCDQIEENRERTYCLRHCKSDKGCRADYDCLLPAEDAVAGEEYALPLLENAAIVDQDYDPDKKWGVCVPEI